MDLNPHTESWTSAEGPYEIADYAASKKANVLVLLNAWLDSGKETEENHDWQTLNYWAARTRPLWTDNKLGSTEEKQPQSDDEGHETIMIVCNRSGEENGEIYPSLDNLCINVFFQGKTFAGTSAIFSLRKGSGHPKLLDMLERKEESVRIWNIKV